MTILDILPLFAGIGLFLYGMGILGAALETVAGDKMEGLLEKLTSNKAKGVLLGTGVTGVIQSSSATTIMVIGLLNAGVLNMVQAVPVIMGANIGTTVTGQLLRLGDLGDGSLVLSLLKPSSFGPVLIGLGAILNLFFHKKKHKDLGMILLGLGILFFGMHTMEATLLPLKEQPWFNDFFFVFRNPLLGVLLGAALTALLQSSSASVGLLQALASTGVIPFATAVPIILGQNVGKCVTVILASFNSKKDGKRAVLINTMVNIIGMLLFFAVIYGGQSIFGYVSFWDSPMTRGNIADFHTLFNVINTLVLLPFTGKFIAFSKKVVPYEEDSLGYDALNWLDDMLLATPNVAVEQCRKVMRVMAEMVRHNFNSSIELVRDYDQKKMERVKDREDLIDRYETAIGNYLVKITARPLRESDNQVVTEMLHAVGDLERMADHSMNLAEVAQYNSENDIQFSDIGRKELRVIGAAVDEIVGLSTEAYLARDLSKATRVEPLEEVIDRLYFDLKEKHITRLRKGQCSVRAGISFVELLTNLERVSDHCSNIALYVLQEFDSNAEAFNGHEVLTQLHSNPPVEYQTAYREYEEKYALPQ